MTRDTIIARLQARFGDTGNAVFDAAYYCNAVNEAYSQIVAASPFWPFLESTSAALSTTAGDNTISMPSDAWHILTLMNTTDQVRMTEITGRRTYEDMYPDPTITGTPIQYRLLNNVIYIYPIPTQTTNFSIDYPVRPARFTSGSDVPVFPDQYVDTIIEYALATCHADDGNMDQYNIHMAVYKSKLQEMLNDLIGTPKGDSYPQINDTWSW